VLLPRVWKRAKDTWPECDVADIKSAFIASIKEQLEKAKVVEIPWISGTATVSGGTRKITTQYWLTLERGSTEEINLGSGSNNQNPRSTLRQGIIRAADNQRLKDPYSPWDIDLGNLTELGKYLHKKVLPESLGGPTEHGDQRSQRQSSRKRGHRQEEDEMETIYVRDSESDSAGPADDGSVRTTLWMSRDRSKWFMSKEMSSEKCLTMMSNDIFPSLTLIATASITTDDCNARMVKHR
jgi:hypothetical protein